MFDNSFGSLPIPKLGAASNLDFPSQNGECLGRNPSRIGADKCICALRDRYWPLCVLT